MPPPSLYSAPVSPLERDTPRGFTYSPCPLSTRSRTRITVIYASPALLHTRFSSPLFSPRLPVVRPLPPPTLLLHSLSGSPRHSHDSPPPPFLPHPRAPRPTVAPDIITFEKVVGIPHVRSPVASSGEEQESCPLLAPLPCGWLYPFGLLFTPRVAVSGRWKCLCLARRAWVKGGRPGGGAIRVHESEGKDRRRFQATHPLAGVGLHFAARPTLHGSLRIPITARGARIQHNSGKSPARGSYRTTSSPPEQRRSEAGSRRTIWHPR